MFSALDSLLIAAALLVMLVGFARRRVGWRKGAAEAISGDWKQLVVYLAGHRKVRKRPWTGAAHLVLVWGFLVFLIVMVAAQFDVRLPVGMARAVSLLLDLLGLAMMGAIVFFLLRRLGPTMPSKDGLAPRGVLLPALLMAAIVATGFMAAGIRLSILGGELRWESPLGWMVAAVMPASPLTMQIMIRVHFGLVLLFAALIPFTFMRHLPAATLNVFYHRRGPAGVPATLPPDAERAGAAIAADFAWKDLLNAEACVACGRCVESCPAAVAGKTLSPRKIVQDIAACMQTGGTGVDPPLAERINAEEIWDCTTCMACVQQCPVYVDPVAKIIAMRRHRVMDRGQLPVEAHPAMRNMALFGDTQGKGRALRLEWAHDHEVPVFGRDCRSADLLLWVGCAGAFHPQYQQVMRAMVKILDRAGVGFAVLGKDESCCGDPARRLGEETLFMQLAQENMARLEPYGFKEIVTLCPHCFHSLKHEYSALGADFKVRPAIELIIELLDAQRIVPRYPVARSLTIHDPCYLGRINGIHEPLRAIGRNLPGSEIKELENSCENGFCCGAGGGHMWLHDSSGDRINHLRAEEVAALGTERVASACPYCLTMLTDGLQTVESSTKATDIVELVAASIG